MTSHSDNILEFIRRFAGRDDDEISRLLHIEPRQAVNQACRRLERAGKITRCVGPNGKLVNLPIRTSQRPTLLAEGDVVGEAVSAPPGRPTLTRTILSTGGFVQTAVWKLRADGRPTLVGTLPESRGVYSFLVDDRALYVGVATRGLGQRLRFYAAPGATQRTNLRVNQLILDILSEGSAVSVMTVTPPDQVWNGMPINGSAGLELGLIEMYDLPWNLRGV